ncbi:FIST N domain protein [Lyngbya aestuarii BL J]|uniref:FIST N domain protein n=1 Tax=Lyngbya aestuarii BL J TaxID=1348334 RepID=U7QEE2_9CYAN|nr:FIST N-terminal domain-containing protein [Lyngbya aestuarii]ERT06278.1 FIST N domain protein [Lyngbya aestuarii BL J]
MLEPTTEQIQWVNALSKRPSLEAAIDEVVEQIQQALPASPNFGLVFISSAFASEYSRLMPLLQERLNLSAIIGCGGAGIVGVNSNSQAEEIEGEPALSLSLAHLPGVQVHPFHLSDVSLPDLDSPPEAWVDLIGVDPSEQPQFILLVDPMYNRINDLLQGLDYAYPGSVKVGGLASGGLNNITAVFHDSQHYQGEVVGVALCGNIVLETIVAQGCRPVGLPYRVTKGERNIILQLEQEYGSGELSYGGSGESLSPLEALQELVQDLSEPDRQLAQNSLFVGVVRDEFKQQLEPGDFLIRNLLGVDPRIGAIAIGDRVRPGQRIQFHLRDAETSKEDLQALLTRYQQQHPNSSQLRANAGALMFSCLGRGEGLYGEPNFDSSQFQRYLNIPVSGLFCNGEIGPVGEGTFLHGYTSVFGIVRQP